MKNIKKLSVVLTFICGVFNLSVYANNVEKIVSWQNQPVKLDLGYPEEVIIKTWTNNEIKLTADVDLIHSDGDNLSDRFSWQVKAGNQSITIKADYGDKLANTVLLKHGTDISGGMPGNSMVTATKIVVYVPINLGLSISSVSGNMNIQHPGSDLLIDTIGNVEVSIESQQSATVTASSLMGEIKILSPSMTVKNNNQSDSKNTLVLNTKRQLFKLNGGGAETSIVTITGNIQITSATQLEIESLK